jgi:hypothetical protein
MNLGDAGKILNGGDGGAIIYEPVRQNPAGKNRVLMISF